ncbi:MAG: hypothetical protein II499_09195 [Firmicutes bacterium]|nr:hypothetical protein [Bacillota bacterium]MBQ3577563.1 hypothetical protein [Bacillota bacterium]MBQ4234658.1 hypothetical protein [Bacillota bacterium]MBQ5436706.1 hypothetical protein [Bacillota bacterium]MBQ6012418.1 hypothetical protein [Bacillota bacterium]
MKYVNQLEYPWIMYQTNREHPEDTRRDHGTFAMSGCGLASAIMVADRLLVDHKFDLFDAVALSYEVNANHVIGTDYNIFAPAFAEKLGLELLPTADIDEARRCLRTGGAVVAISTGDRPDGHVGLFTHGAHYIAIVSELRDGRVAILDPSLSPEKFEEEARRDKVQVDGKLVYAKLEDVLADYDRDWACEYGVTADWPFWCFWKKI